jgi:HEAT repeat protein
MSDPQALMEDLKNSDLSIKKKAIFTLGEKKVKEAIPDLLQLLESDPDKVVRNSSARAFGKIGVKSDEIFDALGKALTDSDMYVRSNACWSLGKLKDKRAIPLLEKMVDPNQRLYTKAADLDGVKGGNSASSSLKEEGIKFSDVIIAAIKALGLIKDPAGIPALALGLEDEEDGAVRCAACLAMGKIGSKVASPYLIKALNDKYWYVRRDAAKALVKLKDPSAAATLASKLNDMYDEVREYSLKALLGIGKPAGAIIFKLYLKDPKNAKFKNFITKTLNKEDIEEILRNLIKDERNPETKKVYETYLARIIG